MRPESPALYKLRIRSLVVHYMKMSLPAAAVVDRNDQVSCESCHLATTLPAVLSTSDHGQWWAD